MRRILLAALLLAAAPAQAALSPFYDSAEKIGTILHSSEVAAALGQRPVRAIENTGSRADGAGEWTIRTQDCDLVVYLVPVPPDMPGKTTYRLDVPNACK